MLFTAPQFLFVFLPIVLAGVFVLGRFGAARLAVLWLTGASLVFYAAPNPRRLLPVICISVAFNYAVSYAMARRNEPRTRRLLLWLGVGGNLVALFWFKYAAFAAANLAALGVPVSAVKVLLPIGISFFTFTQIAFLVDVYRNEVREYRPLHYLLFVTFFPHLVAGPILHHREMMPQLARSGAFRAHLVDIATGLSWFAAGLFKKVVLADGVAPHAGAVFDAAAGGGLQGTAEAWLGALGYTLQLYFDFSGYSDMAIGLALMLGITFPLNFFSPYKATSLIEFWRRWHMTLSRFLRDYLYIPLGGNRRGPMRRHLNLVLTMVLGGLWHGAAWTFVAWGALHGAGLVANHLWRGLGVRLPAVAGQAATLLLVVLAWVPFRADGMAAAAGLWSAMLVPRAGAAVPDWTGWAYVAALSAIALLLPNTAEVFGRPEAAAGSAGPFRWRPSPGVAVLLGLGLGLAVSLSIVHPTAFLYFRF